MPPDKLDALAQRLESLDEEHRHDPAGYGVAKQAIVRDMRDLALRLRSSTIVPSTAFHRHASDADARLRRPVAANDNFFKGA